MEIFRKNFLEIVLFEPQIPQNTGNIGRLCVNTDTKLHLIEPLGFSLDEKYIRRTGMDYWQYVSLNVHKSWSDFLKNVNDESSLFFFSTKGKKFFWDCPYKPEKNERVYLVFGNETSGFSKEIYKKYADRLYTIPMYGKHCRSYNLANSVAIVLFEGIRKILNSHKMPERINSVSY